MFEWVVFGLSVLALVVNISPWVGGLVSEIEWRWRSRHRK